MTVTTTASAAPTSAPPKKTCAAADGWVPYHIDVGPPENAAALGPSANAADNGPPLRGTLTALTAPAGIDAANFAMYLPYYVTGAYKDAVLAQKATSGTITITIALDQDANATSVDIRAPGFPKTFVDEVRERAMTRYESCAPLASGASIRATMTLEPRRLQLPGKG